MQTLNPREIIAISLSLATISTYESLNTFELC